MADLPPSKRIRRNTKRCYECRRRKVKCQLASEDVAACSECIRTGSKCTLLGPGAGRSDESSILLSDHDGRLERIEQILRTLIGKQESSKSSLHTTGDMQQQTTWDEFLNQDLFTNCFDIPNPLEDPVSPKKWPQLHEMQLPLLQYKNETAKQILLELLPSPNDAMSIFTHTGTWVMELPQPPGVIWKLGDQSPVRDVCSAAQFSTMALAKAILFFALSIQQLPPDFKIGQLQMDNVDGQVRRYTQVVGTLVLAHEEVSCSPDGLECLLILGMIHINEGDLKQAWMKFRRALDVAQLLGFHKSYEPRADQSESQEIAFQRRLWLSSVMGDRFCSLILGFEPKAGIQPFGTDYDWDDPFADENANFQRRLCILSGQISQRNLLRLQSGLDEVKTMNSALDRLQSSVQDSWWQRPNLGKGQSLDCALDYDRLLSHLWFFQLQIFVNLPFLISSEPEAERYRHRCLEAAKTSLYRYLGLGLIGITRLHCRAAEIAAFVASLVLVLDLSKSSCLESSNISGSSNSNVVLLEQIIDSLTALGRSSEREHFALKSAEILTMLLEKLKMRSFHNVSEVHEGNDSARFSYTLGGQVGMHELLLASVNHALGDQPASHIWALDLEETI